MDKGKEKRKFQRKELNTELKYSVLYPSYKTGITKDISEGGLCILINEQVTKGSILRVEFNLPGGGETHIEAVGKVVWQAKKGDKFLTGVEFLTGV